MKAPRGIRNNNPLNIRVGKSDWQGLDPAPETVDKEFCQFTHPYFGIRAGAKLLRNYVEIYNIADIDRIVQRFAPHTENNVRAYTSFIVRKTGFGAKDRLALHKTNVMERLLAAMIQFETGLMPYSKELMRAAIEATPWPEAIEANSAAQKKAPKAPAAPKDSGKKPDEAKGAAKVKTPTTNKKGSK